MSMRHIGQTENAFLLFLAYPNFDGGSLLHDPSMGLVESANPSNEETTLGVPTEAIALVIVGVVLISIVGLIVFGKRR
ncbi:MAG: LPXTG cell wall anchor domain-containing protein [Candidatus Thorarchaeota archaeon]|nr:LPXTG cell wall anchor domain-containing protein [Candidatus Thorarchaeota archaeon]